jgi:hypothetical protein
MALADAQSLAATSISVLFWWTVLSPLVLLAIAVLVTRRTRLRAFLTLVTVLPPLLLLLPLAVMSGSGARLAAAGAGAALEAVAAGLAAAGLGVAAEHETHPWGGWALAAGNGGGMVGSAALVITSAID